MAQHQRLEERVRSAEERCARYRAAFERMLQERFVDLDSTLERLLEVLATTLQVGRVSHWLFEPGRTAIRCTHRFLADRRSLAGPDFLSREGCSSYFEAVGRQLVIDAHDAHADERTREMAESYLAPCGIGAMLDVPVVAFGQYVGILCHEHLGGPRTWTPEDQHFAACVATQVALAHEREHARLAQQALLHRSLRDEETGLSNVVHLRSRLEDSLPEGSRGLAFAVASVDQFDFLAGVLGAGVVKEWVRLFGAQVEASAPAGAFAARTGPNEFALVAPDVEPEAAARLFQEWIEAFLAPVEVAGRRCFVSLSAGFTCRERGERSRAEDLRTEARLAKEHARTEGGNRLTRYRGFMGERMVARAAMEQDLRRALKHGEFELHYQPIVDLASGGCEAIEALIRWRHPEHGLLTPDRFLGVAQDAGLMPDLGSLVVVRACSDLHGVRQRTGLTSLRLCLNISAAEILLPETPGRLLDAIRRGGIEPRDVVLEVTESAFIMDLARAREAMSRLRELGFRVSLDDFGTAYSSLTWLRELPVDEVKVDRAFVGGIEHDARDRAIVRGILELARAFAHGLVAEGIETAGQLSLLRELGLRHGQGYLFAAPTPAEDIDREWVAKVADGARPG